MIDQTLLPQKYKIIKVDTLKKLWHAIKTLKVRGAPAIGVSAAFGMLLASEQSKGDYKKDMRKAAKYLASSRPTAVNLFWAIDRMMEILDQKLPVPELKKLIKKEALKIYEEDRKLCRQIGKHGNKIIKNGAKIITHCNAGGLATADYGTALACMFAAHERGKKIHVFADETRPLDQGVRLTMWELQKAGIKCTLICDSMSAQVMDTIGVDCVIVGADRIAANGDAANKIGTYGLALIAKAHGVPFYVAAPFSTFDFSLKSGKEIPIEFRDPKEVTSYKCKVHSPAFDVTPASLIKGIITEKGIILKPTTAKIKKLYSKV